ncbi:MAG: MFS transporter [Symbiobacteriia bacterium]
MTEKPVLRNFIGGTIHGVFFAISTAFSQPDTILPVYIGLLSDSKLYVGLLSSVLVGGQVLPQLAFARLLEPRPAKKPWLMLGIVIRVAAWFFLGLSTLTLGKEHPTLVLGSLFFWLAAFSVGGALAGVAFADVMGKAIPLPMRGRFFGLRQFLGSLLAFTSGLLVKRILANRLIPFPTNYAYLFLLSSLALAIAALGFWMIREPLPSEPCDSRPCPKAPASRPQRHGEFLRRIVQFWRGDPLLRELIIAQNVVGLNLMLIPFYVIFARERLHDSGALLGTFIMFQVAGAAVSNILWAWVNDRFGSRLLLRTVILLNALIPLVALALGAAAPAFFPWLYALLGAESSGRSVAYNTNLIDIAPPSLRATYAGMQGTLTSPTLLFPFVGGLLIPLLGYGPVFTGVATVLLLLFVFASTSGRSGPPRARLTGQ